MFKRLNHLPTFVKVIYIYFAGIFQIMFSKRQYRWHKIHNCSASIIFRWLFCYYNITVKIEINLKHANCNNYY